MVNTQMKDSRSDLPYNIFSHVFVGALFIAVLYPLIFIVSASFSSPDAVVSGWVRLWPVQPSLEGYKAVFDYDPIWIGYRNSLLYTLIGTIVNVVMTILAAYPLSRKDCYGRNFIMLFIAFTMLFSGGLIPTYLVVNSLGMVDTFWALIIPSAITVYQVIITKSYFQTMISDEILDAAKIDGCNDFTFVIKVVLPLSKAIIAVITLFYAVGHWNAFFNALIYLRTRDKFPLQMFLRDILIVNSVDTSMLGIDIDAMDKKEGLRELLKYAVIILASLPVLIMYPFVQKYFVKGIMIGSLKG